MPGCLDRPQVSAGGEVLEVKCVEVRRKGQRAEGRDAIDLKEGENTVVGGIPPGKQGAVGRIGPHLSGGGRLSRCRYAPGR